MNLLWTRRSFLTNAGLAAAAATLPLASPWAEAEPSRRSVAFIAHRPMGSAEPSSIQIVSVDGSRWTPSHSTFYPARHPDLLAIHPTSPVLYAASAADPAQSLSAVVSAFAIKSPEDLSSTRTPRPESLSGQPWLSPTRQQPLAHATTAPRDLVVTADGRWLLVADRRGQLNLLPVGAAGDLRPLEHVRKLTGSAHAPLSLSRPSSLLMHSTSGLAFVADAGANQVARFSLVGDDPCLLSPLTLPPRFVPLRLAIDPANRVLAVSSAASAAVALFHLDPDTGDATRPPAVLSLPNALFAAGALAFAPHGSHLLVTALHGSGQRRRTHVHVLAMNAALQLTPRHSRVLGAAASAGSLRQYGSTLLHSNAHGITELALDQSGTLQRPPAVVYLAPGLSSVALWSA